MKHFYTWLIISLLSILFCQRSETTVTKQESNLSIDSFRLLKINQIKDEISNRLPIDVEGKIDTKNYIIRLTVPSLTNVSQLKPVFTGTFKYVKANTEEQISSVTTINLEKNTIYTIFDEDNHYKNYLIQVVREAFTSTPPEAYNLKISGNATVYDTLTANYIYADSNFDIEGNSSIRWLISENGSQYKIIPGATKKTYKIEYPNLGQFIAFEITPITKYSEKGAPTYSSPTEAIKNKEDSLLISELGNSIHSSVNNDYIVIFNSSNTTLLLSNFYIARDSDCNIENGWSEFKQLPNINLDRKKYYLLSRENNTIQADSIWSGSISNAYCIILSKSKVKPTNIEDSNIVDFISFGDTILKDDPITYLSPLINGEIIRRKGICYTIDTNSNVADFIKIIPTAGYLPNNVNTPPCYE